MTEEQKMQLAVSMCYTWKHDFGLDRPKSIDDDDDMMTGGTTPAERERLVAKMLSLIEHHWPGEAGQD